MHRVQQLEQCSTYLPSSPLQAPSYVQVALLCQYFQAMPSTQSYAEILSLVYLIAFRMHLNVGGTEKPFI